jgi:hypothetical protein
MAKMFGKYSHAQYVVTDGDINTSNVIVSGSLRIDWNKYVRKNGLMDCLDFRDGDTHCNVPDVSLITIAGDVDV